jgi:hypothetical protein
MTEKKTDKVPKGLEHLLEKRETDRRGKDRRSTKAAVAVDRRKNDRRRTGRRKKA